MQRNWIVLVLLSLYSCQIFYGQEIDTIPSREIKFKSQGVTLVGTLYQPAEAHAAVVIVHGSDAVPRMSGFAEQLASKGLLVFTYDKRGVGESGGVYAGPEVGTNNIDPANLDLLAEDASAAVNALSKYTKGLSMGLIGFSQAGWIIPMAAKKNTEVDFMVLFSGPLITTLEQLRFQFYTDGRKDFWEHHTEADAREHTLNDPDRYQFSPTDPVISLGSLEIPGIWLFGEKDIQIPVVLCIEELNALKAVGKPYEYVLFPELGHNTAFAENQLPVEIALAWIKQRSPVDRK